MPFAEAISAFRDVCLSTAPSFRGANERLLELGATGRSISGAYVHPVKSLRGQTFSLDSQTVTCEVSAEIHEGRLGAEQLFRSYVARLDPNARESGSNKMISRQDRLAKFYIIEESISTGRSTMSLTARYEN